MKQATRSLNLPKPIAAYFIADEVDGEAVSQCFTANAVVKDEGHTPKGRAPHEPPWYPRPPHPALCPGYVSAERSTP